MHILCQSMTYTRYELSCCRTTYYEIITVSLFSPLKGKIQYVELTD